MVEANTLTLTGGAGILSDTSSSGSGDTVTIAAMDVTLTNGAFIEGRTSGPGPGGTVRINADGLIALSGQDSGLFTTAAGSGAGGDIALHARTIELRVGAVLAASSTGTGNAGSIRLEATDTFRSAQSTVTTDAVQADGGNIEVRAQALVRLRDSALTATVGGGAQTVGGNITIDPEFVLLENSAAMRSYNVVVMVEDASASSPMFRAVCVAQGSMIVHICFLLPDNDTN